MRPGRWSVLWCALALLPAGCGDTAVGTSQAASKPAALDRVRAAAEPVDSNADGGPPATGASCQHAPTYAAVTSYPIEVAEVRVTRGGVRVIDPEGAIDDHDLDRKTDELARCLADLSGQLAPAEAEAAACLSLELARELPAACLQVRLADDWSLSACSGEEVFPCDVDPQVCRDKGQELTPECPCRCRAALQDGWVVVTPNLKLYKAELARLVTGCNDPWRIDRLAGCL